MVMQDQVQASIKRRFWGPHTHWITDADSIFSLKAIILPAAYFQLPPDRITSSSYSLGAIHPYLLIPPPSSITFLPTRSFCSADNML